MGFEPTVEFPLHTLSKRAQSTTLTSLLLESTICEQSGTVYRKTLLQIVLIPDAIWIQQFTGAARMEFLENCVRPCKVVRSLTAILLSLDRRQLRCHTGA